VDAEAVGTFGDLLRRYRAAAELTQEALAARTGLTPQAISLLERGVRQHPHAYTVHQLAEALGLAEGDRVRFAAAARGREERGVACPGPGSAVDRARTAPPLVGRGRELALLERHLAGEGPPVLLLAGEPGIGKSRLLHEAGQRTGTHGLCVLAGGCQRRGDQEPYTPLLPALAHHLHAQAPAQLRTALRGCAWLVRLLPELAGGPIEPLPAWTLPPEQERRLLFAAVARYLRNVAGPGGTLLLLDDLQWAGPDALALLASLLHADAPLRVLGAYRDTEVPAQDALAGTLGDLAQAGLAAQHALRPLAPADAARLLEELVPEERAGAGAQRERVLQRAGGVPFVLVSYAQALRTHLPAEGPTDVAVPWDVAQGVRQRVAALAPLAHELLDVAAVVGRQAPWRVLQGVVAQPEEAVVAALEEACQARLLEEEPEGYRFAHDVIREVVEGQLSQGRRLLLHWRIAETLEAAEGEPPVELLAYHYSQGDVHDKAVHYLEQAGERAQAQYAHAAAEAYYRELVERLDRLGRVCEAARAREKLGAVLATVGRCDAALAVLEQAVETYRTDGDLEGVRRTLAQVGQVHATRGTAEDGVRRLWTALETMDTREPSPGLAALYGALAHLYFVSGQSREQLVAAERAVDVSRVLGEERIRADAETRRALALLAMGRVEEARQELEEVIPLAEAVGDLDILNRALTQITSVYIASGEYDKSRWYGKRALEGAEQRGDAAQIVFTGVTCAISSFSAGDWLQARAHLERVLALSREIGEPRAMGPPLVELARLSLAEGAWDDASRYLEESLALSERSDAVTTMFWLEQALLSERDILEGHPEVARGRLALLLAGAGQHPRPAPVYLLSVPQALSILAWAHVELGDITEADEAVRQAITRARAMNYRLAWVNALRVQAMVRICQEHWDEAEQALEEGLALARSMPYPYGEARLLHVYGGMHAQKGEPAPARGRLEAALAIFRRLGARKDAEWVEQALTTLHGAPPHGVSVHQTTPVSETHNGVADASAGRRLSRTERQAWALEHLRRAGPLSPRTYATALAVSVDTALRDLQELVDRGLVQAAGTTKDRRYVLAGVDVVPEIHRTAP
jgi:tetratricopeptide (TPR) repeat protein/transcriptional regulator with XRE-family HTH domain